MNKTLKIITIIGVLCMLVPFMVLGSFASAETVTEDGAEFVFYEMHPSFYDGSAFSLGYDTDNGHFATSLSIPFSSDYFLNGFFLAQQDYTLSLDGSPSVAFLGDYAFSRFTYPSATAPLVIATDTFDKKLHAYLLVCIVPTDVSPADHLIFNGYPLLDFCMQSQLEMSFIPDDGLYITGSQTSSANPSFVFQLFVNSIAPEVEFFSTFYDAYILTWYGSPSVNVLTCNYSELYFLSYVDMVVVNAGYETGYREGVTAGKQQGYDEGFTAGEQQGYEEGVTDGKYQANNTVNTGSASYIKGYQDGLDAPEYSFMSLISSIIDAPIRAFFGYTENGVTHPGLFNFNILGYDMSNLVLSIFSLCVLITILRLILGGK